MASPQPSRACWMFLNAGAQWASWHGCDSTSGSAGSASARPGWWRATTGCSRDVVTGIPRTDPLRVGVLVESLIVPEWVQWTIAQIDATDTFELIAVVPAAGVGRVATSRRRTRDLTYRLYEWVDRRVFGPAPAMRDADLSAISSGRTT